MTMLNEGDPVPDVTLAGHGRQAGQRRATSGARSSSLYFYPKDDTSGCTTEAKAFTALADEFREGRHLDPRRLQGRREEPREVHRQI